jgi:hypothetical protein
MSEIVYSLQMHGGDTDANLLGIFSSVEKAFEHVGIERVYQDNMLMPQAWPEMDGVSVAWPPMKDSPHYQSRWLIWQWDLIERTHIGMILIKQEVV